MCRPFLPKKSDFLGNYYRPYWHPFGLPKVYGDLFNDIFFLFFIGVLHNCYSSLKNPPWMIMPKRNFYWCENLFSSIHFLSGFFNHSLGGCGCLYLLLVTWVFYLLWENIPYNFRCILFCLYIVLKEFNSTSPDSGVCPYSTQNNCRKYKFSHSILDLINVTTNMLWSLNTLGQEEIVR